MNIILWIIQGLLALAFIAAGGLKVFAYEKYKAMLTKQGMPVIERGLVTFIGIAEIAGGLGIVLPMATGIAPWLSPWSAIGLATVMLLAIGFHLRGHEPAPGPIALLLLSAFVAVGRLAHWA